MKNRIFDFSHPRYLKYRTSPDVALGWDFFGIPIPKSQIPGIWEFFPPKNPEAKIPKNPKFPRKSHLWYFTKKLCYGNSCKLITVPVPSHCRSLLLRHHFCCTFRGAKNYQLNCCQHNWRCRVSILEPLKGLKVFKELEKFRLVSWLKKKGSAYATRTRGLFITSPTLCRLS